MWRFSVVLVALFAAASFRDGNSVASAAAADEFDSSSSVGGLSHELLSAFKKWMVFHGKEYDSHEEKLKRLQIWIDNDGKSVGCVDFL
jgi:hypothetical protein